MEPEERPIMNCRDFDQIWNQALDARRRGAAVDGDRAGRAEALRAHAEACPSCLVRHRRFERLRQALDAWTARAEARPPAEPSADAADRIVAVVGRPEAPAAGRRRLRLPETALVLASAAAVLVATVGFWLRPEPPGGAADASPAREDPDRDRGLLANVVGDATAASWELALLTAEPAARLGKDMIGVPFEAEGAGGSFQLDGPAAMGEPFALEAESFSPGLIDRMGGLLADGVRPLSTSARRAFGFLRAPTAESTDRPVARPARGKGA